MNQIEGLDVKGLNRKIGQELREAIGIGMFGATHGSFFRGKVGAENVRHHHGGCFGRHRSIGEIADRHRVGNVQGHHIAYELHRVGRVVVIAEEMNKKNNRKDKVHDSAGLHVVGMGHGEIYHEPSRRQPGGERYSRSAMTVEPQPAKPVYNEQIGG